MRENEVSSVTCTQCARRYLQSMNRKDLVRRAAEGWFRGLGYTILTAILGLLGEQTFALWRFLSESGRTRAFASQDANLGSIAYNHAGWGYGWTSLFLVLILLTLVSAVILAKED